MQTNNDDLRNIWQAEYVQCGIYGKVLFSECIATSKEPIKIIYCENK